MTTVDKSKVSAILLSNGLEIVAETIKPLGDSDHMVIKNPRIVKLVQTENGVAVMVTPLPPVVSSKPDVELVIDRESTIFTTAADETVAQQYVDLFTEIVTPPDKKIVLPGQ